MFKRLTYEEAWKLNFGELYQALEIAYIRIDELEDALSSQVRSHHDNCAGGDNCSIQVKSKKLLQEKP